MTKKIKTVAVIAHVDHGKTTLVDQFISQKDRAMDSDHFEKARGITILAKCTTLEYNGYTINITDTPGHADFASEVERSLAMIDGVLLVVDSSEGVMPQTKFVLTKALEKNLPVIVFVNKIDKPSQRADEVELEVLGLIEELNPKIALNTPVLFGSGRDGYAANNLEDALNGKSKDITPLTQAIIDHIPGNFIEEDDNKPFSFLVSMIDYDKYLGKMLIGRITSGSIQVNDQVYAINQNNEQVDKYKISKIFGFFSGTKKEIDKASAGEIVCICGSDKATVNDTISMNGDVVIPAPIIEEPTLCVTFSVNKSPLAGKDGSNLTFRQIKERIFKESKTNVGIRIDIQGEEITVYGRGEMQIGILVDNLRLEGYEFTISSAKVVTKNINGKVYEPVEEITVSSNPEDMSVIQRILNGRGGSFIDMTEQGKDMKIIYKLPSRLTSGLKNELLQNTSGRSIFGKRLLQYEEFKKHTQIRPGLLISMESGKISAYALNKLKDRGVFFVNPGDEVYKNMVIGESKDSNHMEVNPVKTKQLTNMRASGKDESISLSPAILFQTEEAIAYSSQYSEGDKKIKLEITPSAIRMVV